MHLGCGDCTTIAVAVPGPPGPTGPSGEGAASYIHEQTVAATVWHVVHNLGQQIVDATTVFSLDYQTQWDGVIVEPLDANSCDLFFADAITGRALIKK